MGKGKARHFDPFFKNNKGIYVPKTIEPPRIMPLPHGPRNLPHVEATRDIKITDKTVSFVAGALDCCIEKVVKEYVPYFQNEGYQVTVTLQKGMEEIIKLIPRWVVLVRVGTSNSFPQEIGLPNVSRIIKHLQKLGIRVVYYIDDFLVAANGNAPIAIASMCDAVIVATTELRDFFKNIQHFKAPIIHVPTHIDIPIFDAVPTLDYIKNINRFKVLMTSSGRVGATGLFEICEKANEIPEFEDIQFIINSGGVAQMRTLVNSFRHLHKIYVDNIPLNQYYGLCKSVNMIINPAAERDLDYLVPPQYQHTWLHSKSALKYTMAGGARIPIVSSPMRSYVEAIKDGETGFIVDTPEGFIEKILYFKNNPAKTARMGIAARMDIMENYDIRKRYPSYRDAIIGAGETTTPQIVVEKEKPIEVALSSSLTGKKVFIPSLGEGGPGSFYANMRKYLPIVSEGKWSVTNQLGGADVAIAVAFLAAGSIFEEKEKRGLKYIYRVDGLPMNFDGGLHPDNLKIMQELFRHASATIWQSKHCMNMWNDKGLIPVEVDPHNKIIHNGVDTSIFKPRDYKREDTGKVNLLHINWSTFPHKRIDLLEKIVKASLIFAPNIQFFMLGNYINTNPITNAKMWENYTNVTYLGQITDRNKASMEDLISIYHRADALLFTSEMEGSPNTVLEATACGIPIIYNNAVDIVPEICGDACVGFSSEKDFIDKYHEALSIKPILKDEFTMQSCTVKYMRFLDVLVKY